MRCIFFFLGPCGRKKKKWEQASPCAGFPSRPWTSLYSTQSAPPHPRNTPRLVHRSAIAWLHIRVPSSGSCPAPDNVWFMPSDLSWVKTTSALARLPDSASSPEADNLEQRYDFFFLLQLANCSSYFFFYILVPKVSMRSGALSMTS